MSLKIFFFRPSTSGRQYEVITDETGRERRRVIFPVNDDDDEDDDDEDDSAEDNDALENDMDSDEEGNEDGFIMGDIENEIEAVVKDKKGKKKRKNTLSADEDIEDESEQEAEKSILSKKRKVSKGRTSLLETPSKKVKKSIENNEVNSDEEIVFDDGKKIRPLKETDVQYTKLSQDKGSEIRSKIADALSMLEKGKTEKPSAVFSDEEEDWSHSSDDEESNNSESDFDEDSDLSEDEGGESDGSVNGHNEEQTPSTTVNGGSAALAEEDSIRWKSNLQQKAADAFIERQASTQNLWKMVYGMMIFTLIT